MFMKIVSQVVPPGFEPGSPAPKAGMIDHYTTGLWTALYSSCIKASSNPGWTRHRNSHRTFPIRYVGWLSVTLAVILVPKGISLFIAIGR